MNTLVGVKINDVCIVFLFTRMRDSNKIQSGMKMPKSTQKQKQKQKQITNEPLL